MVIVVFHLCNEQTSYTLCEIAKATSGLNILIVDLFLCSRNHVSRNYNYKDMELTIDRDWPLSDHPKPLLCPLFALRNVYAKNSILRNKK